MDSVELLEELTSSDVLYWISAILRRRDLPERAVMLGKVEDSRKRGRGSVRWVDAVKEAKTFSWQEYKPLTTQLFRCRATVCQTQHGGGGGI